MNDLGKLLLLLVLVAVVAAATCRTTAHFLARPASQPADFHHWLHAQLGITVEQDKALEQEEDRFTLRRKELVATIQEDNQELAAAMMQDRDYSPQVRAAIEKIHHAQSMLEEATLQHIFAMKPILSPDQFNKLLKLTGEALNSPPDL